MIDIIGFTRSTGSGIALVAFGLSSAVPTDHSPWSKIEFPSRISTQLQSSSSPLLRVSIADQFGSENELAREVARLYRNLLDYQEPLGSAFEQVWDANVDKLYEA